MKNRIYITLMAAALLAAGPRAGAQDLHFSQFFEAPLLRNPSLAGIFEGDYRVQTVYRDQWNSVTNAYRTGSVNGEMRMPIGRGNDFITTGLQVLFDRAGTIGWTTTQVLPALNYHKSLSNEKNSYLSLGFMGGPVTRRFDASKATTNSQYETGGLGENFANTRYSYLDGSVGMSYNSNLRSNPDNNYYVGAAYHHFNKPKQNNFVQNTEIPMNPKWVFSAGLRLGVSDYSFITLQADHSRQGGFQEYVGGMLYGFRFGEDPQNPRYVLHAGGFLRWNDALIPMLKLDYAPLSITLSYDVNVSKLRTSSYGRGGFEVGLSWRAFRAEKGEYLLCPKF